MSINNINLKESKFNMLLINLMIYINY